VTIVIQLPPRGADPEDNGLVCSECGAKNCPSLHNGRCPECADIAQTAWTAKMAIRQDPAQFDMKKLIGLLLRDHWMHECEIIPAYMPPFPRPDTQPTCVVRYVYPSGEDTFLRYSNGPLQGYFWDMYGDDMHSPELALVAISQASAPTRVGVVIPTHGR
jgi:hypothetical protein